MACTCKEIREKDPRRHFKGCEEREATTMTDDPLIHIACYDVLRDLAREDEIYTHAGAVNARGAHQTGARMLELLRSKGFEIVRR